MLNIYMIFCYNFLYSFNQVEDEIEFIGIVRHTEKVIDYILLKWLRTLFCWVFHCFHCNKTKCKQQNANKNRFLTFVLSHNNYATNRYVKDYSIFV